MEKRKVFKISIIDKEISRTEFDRNTFYTSDSELSLVFKLIEKDYSYDHGEILLYNEDDNSFVTREITKQENDFVYELDLDIIPHFGKWQAQLQLVNDGDVYTSKPFDFSIVNDLSNLAPQPTLTDINNWATLKQSANELIDEMQDIIVDVERAELERASQENYRRQAESERVNKENYRQRTESERISKENTRQKAETERVNNEKQRQISESEREKKENTRQQAESQRQSTFETNESERENTFETGEAQRETAELSRVSAEEQRKIDHENRSVELDSKADKVVLENLVENGDFSKGTTGWEFGQLSSGMVVSNGVSKVSARYVSYSPYYSTPIDKDKKYFISSKIKNVDLTSGSGASFGLTNGNSPFAESQLMGKYFDEIDTEKFSRVSRVVTANNNYTSIALMRFTTNLASPQNAYFDDVIFVNLTDTFGLGNEPSKEEMDEIIKLTGYIDSEYALNNKEMLIWTLGLIRQNKNAIISLGGTI